MVETHRFQLNAYLPKKKILHAKQPARIASARERSTRERSTKNRLSEKTLSRQRPNARATKVGLPPPKLDLSLEQENDFSHAPDTRLAPQGGMSSNGATIMNGELFELIQNAKTHSGNFEQLNRGPSTYGNRGFNGLSTYTKIGGKCFLVAEPNPLDTLSSETWSRVKCR